MSAAILCRHFGVCGGCAYQDMTDDAYRVLKRNGVVDALAQHGLGEASVAEIIAVGAGTRRRANFKAEKRDGEVRIGFHAAASHDIVDMRECLVLAPPLFALVPQMRVLLVELLGNGEKADISVTLTDNGPDVDMALKRRPGSAAAGSIARWAQRLRLARVSIDGVPLVELAQPVVTFGKASVVLPVGAFLQPTAVGEARLRALVEAGLRGAKSIVDLFAGCGTFALTLAQAARVHAVDAEGAQLDALSAAARATQGLKPVTTTSRDLFKLPLGAPELERFDGILLDPPRAGAIAQAREIARSKVRRVVYVSCNPSSFARDARVLVEGGYGMGTATPVDQFLWSSHIELVAAFQRS